MIAPMKAGGFWDRQARRVADLTGMPQQYGRGMIVQVFLVIAALGLITTATNVLCTAWQTSQLLDDAHASHKAYAAYRAQFLCRQDRNMLITEGKRGIEHMCDNAGR